MSNVSKISTVKELLSKDTRLRGLRARWITPDVFGSDVCFFRSGLSQLENHYPDNGRYERVFSSVKSVLIDCITSGCVSGYLYQMSYSAIIKPPASLEPYGDVYWSVYTETDRARPVSKLARFWRSDKIPTSHDGIRPVTFYMDVKKPFQLDIGLWEIVLEPVKSDSSHEYLLVSLKQIDWTPDAKVGDNISRMVPSSECLLPSMRWTYR